MKTGNKIGKKIILAVLYVLILISQIYAIFFYKYDYEKMSYRWLLIISFAIFVIIGLAFIIIEFVNKKALKRIMFFVISTLLILQVATLFFTNINSGTLPFFASRGTVYEYPTLYPEVSSNELSLFLSYYLNGKTLYATPKDNPRDFDNGKLFIEDEYEFVDKLTKVLLYEETQYYKEENKEDYYVFTVLKDQKRERNSFFVFVYANEDYADYDEVMLYKDYFHNWYFIPKELRGEKWQVN